MSRVAGALLLWLAAPYWPRQLEDVFIVLAYAREWWTSGTLRWTSGEVVEGYSNFLFLAALTPIVGLGGDGGLWAKVLAFVGALGVLGLLAAVVPRDLRGMTLIFCLLAWTPFCYWSILGLETPWFAAFVAAGWAATAVGGRWTGGGTVIRSTRSHGRSRSLEHE